MTTRHVFASSAALRAKYFDEPDHPWIKTTSGPGSVRSYVNSRHHTQTQDNKGGATGRAVDLIRELHPWHHHTMCE